MEKEKLYVPQVKVKPEYFPGFGKKELYNTLLMSILVLFFSITLYFLNVDLAAVILIVMVGVSGSIILNTKNAAELSVITFAGLFIRYMREQQSFLYTYQDEWKI